MISMTSRFLGDRELKTLRRIGDLMLPGDHDFPAFSHTGCIAFVDDLLSFMDPKDCDDLKTLLKTLSFFPEPMLRALFALCRTRLTAPFRLIELGLRGLVMSLYYSNKNSPTYSGPKPHEVLGFALRRIRL